MAPPGVPPVQKLQPAEIKPNNPVNMSDPKEDRVGSARRQIHECHRPGSKEVRCCIISQTIITRGQLYKASQHIMHLAGTTSRPVRVTRPLP
ncbi:hypothetical protein U1Q18_004834, partial [Sarracenia purpurea var. burkii]